jgi:hypothetical protein
MAKWRPCPVSETGPVSPASPVLEAGDPSTFGGNPDMAIQVETKDGTALTDADLGELADMSASGGAGFEFGQLSKAKEDWVLAGTARVDGKLHGYSFATLERIGGTPCVLLGLIAIRRTSKRDSVLKAVMGEAYHRALMAFPDEDVLVGSRFASPAGFEAYRALSDIVPRPGHKAVGEERAWGRRLAKRFAVEGTYDEQTFRVTGTGGLAPHLDHESLKPEAVDPDVAAMFTGLRPEGGDCLIAFGWAMAEDLLKLGSH